MPYLADSIMLVMEHHSFLEPFNEVFEDKRSGNSHIPLDTLLALAINAKLYIWLLFFSGFLVNALVH